MDIILTASMFLFLFRVCGLFAGRSIGIRLHIWHRKRQEETAEC